MEQFVVRIGSEQQSPEICAAVAETAETVRSLLCTDVLERLRVPVQPAFLRESGKILCYCIDGRGGEKELPANFLGTCLYHTGCAICGDLVFVLSSPSETDETLFPMSKAQTEMLCTWLTEQFDFLKERKDIRL